MKHPTIKELIADKLRLLLQSLAHKKEGDHPATGPQPLPKPELPKNQKTEKPEIN